MVDYYEIWNVRHRNFYPMFFNAENYENAIKIMKRICEEKTISISLSVNSVSSSTDISCLEIITAKEFNNNHLERYILYQNPFLF